ncbi:hypothetical protein HID58_047960, partial [Brassica napus]
DPYFAVTSTGKLAFCCSRKSESLVLDSAPCTSNGRPEQKLVKDGFIIRKPTKIHCPEEIPRVKED